jgi:hypothetical protein
MVLPFTGSLSTLQYWTQSNLPAVYDDSLSYYELLSKVISQLNATTDFSSSLKDSFNALFTDEWIETKNLKDGIVTSSKIDPVIMSQPTTAVGVQAALAGINDSISQMTKRQGTKISIDEYEDLKVTVVNGYDWTPALNQAQDDLHALGGGVITFSAKNYGFINPTIKYDHIALVGSGREVTILTDLYASGEGLTFRKEDGSQIERCGFQHLTIKADNAKSTGSLITLDRPFLFNASDISLVGNGQNINILHVLDFSNVRISDFDIGNFKGNGIFAEPSYTGNIGGTTDLNLINGLIDAGQDDAGTNIYLAGDPTGNYYVTAINLIAIESYRGLYSLVMDSAHYSRVLGCYFDSSGEGILVKGYSSLNHFVGGWICSSKTGQGITIQDHVNYLSLGHMTIGGNAINGVYLTGDQIQNVIVDSCMIDSNNKTNTADGSGIYVDGSGHFQITNNTIGNMLLGGGHQKHAIYVKQTTSDDYIITGNRPTLNESDHILDNGVGISRIVRDNMQYATDRFKDYQSLTVGVNNTYGAETTIRSKSGLIRSFNVKLSPQGNFAGGETVTIKVTATNGTDTLSLEKPFVNTQDYWLSNDDLQAFWMDSITSVSLSAKSNQAASTVPVVFTIMGVS